MRRDRNIDAVKTAVLDLLVEGAALTMSSIADRAGVAERSLYRYFGDAHSTVHAAITERQQIAIDEFDNQDDIDPHAPLDERVALLIGRRVRLDRLLEPLDGRRTNTDTVTAKLDTEVVAAFQVELDTRPTDHELDTLLCGVLGLGSIRSMRTAFADNNDQIARAVTRIVDAILANQRPSVAPETSTST